MLSQAQAEPIWPGCGSQGGGRRGFERSGSWLRRDSGLDEAELRHDTISSATGTGCASARRRFPGKGGREGGGSFASGLGEEGVAAGSACEPVVRGLAVCRVRRRWEARGTRAALGETGPLEALGLDAGAGGCLRFVHADRQTGGRRAGGRSHAAVHWSSGRSEGHEEMAAMVFPRGSGCFEGAGSFEQLLQAAPAPGQTLRRRAQGPKARPLESPATPPPIPTPRVISALSPPNDAVLQPPRTRGP